MKIDLLYRRPAQRFPKKESDLTCGSDASLSSKPGPAATAGIPPELSFERIVAGHTRSPCSLRDFMRYCLFVEYSAENLQFYLWLRDYTARFDKALKSDKDLSPEWTAGDQAMALRQARADARIANRKLSLAHSLSQQTVVASSISSEKHLTSAIDSAEADNSFCTPPGTPDMSQNTVWPPVPLPNVRDESIKSATGSVMTRSSRDESLKSGFSATTIASESFMSAGLSKPFTVQLFRDEIDKAIATYLADGAPREINLAGPEKRAVLMALQKTTHPSAFTGPDAVVKHTLLTQLHPNFVRWTINNCSMPRRIFCCIFACILIICGFLVSLLLTLSSAARGWRALGAIFVSTGVVYLLVIAKGVCPILYGLRNRHVRPWEVFSKDDYDPVEDAFTSFGGRNGDDDSSWAWSAWYKKRRLVCKIFDSEVPIQEPALRWIQHQIALQAIALSLPVTGAFLAIFLTVPAGRFM